MKFKLIHSSHSHAHPRPSPSNNLNLNHKRTKHMLMFLLLLFCSAAGHAQLYSSVWDGKLVSPPELQQQRSCILGCQLFTEFSHQQSTLPSTGYSVVSKGLGSQTNHHHTGGLVGVVSNLYSNFKRVILP